MKFSFSITTSGNEGQKGRSLHSVFPARSEWTECSRNSPAFHVHGDFTREAAVRRIHSLLGEERAEDWFLNDGHVGILNVWRPIDTVEKSPLGFIDISSVDDEKVRVIFLRKLRT